MAERENSQGGNQNASFGSRSPLLKPIFEGKSLESGDVSGFLAGRLALAQDHDLNRKASLRLNS